MTFPTLEAYTGTLTQFSFGDTQRKLKAELFISQLTGALYPVSRVPQLDPVNRDFDLSTYRASVLVTSHSLSISLFSGQRSLEEGEKMAYDVDAFQGLWVWAVRGSDRQ